MTEQEKCDYLNKLDEELLRGGVMLSEWSTFQIRDADVAYTSGAHLAAILTALAGVESHLRYEYKQEKRQRLVDLIDHAPIEDDLRRDLHRLRRFRNQWVHVDDPAADADLLSKPEKHASELEEMATLAMRALRRTIYAEQWV
ncbi:hypothetical protein HQ590_12760 [bacterium]|nr:hypothetical protein [bacterium]